MVMVKGIVFLFGSLFLTAATFAQFKNIKLDENSADRNACAAAISINRKNPLNIVGAAGRNNVYVTFDGGKNWETRKVSSAAGFSGNPVLTSDSKGTMYYFNQSDLGGKGLKDEGGAKQIVCHVSYDGGKTWDDGSSLGNNSAKDHDRPSAIADAKDNIYVTWTQFNSYGDADSGCQSNIMLSSSTNGRKWSKPIQISQTPGNCLDNDSTAAGATAAVSIDKKMYVVWSNQGKIFMDRSFNGGSMWLSNDLAIAEQPGGWKMKIPGVDSCSGFPVLMVERAKGSRQGMLYMTWADQRNGEDDTDIWFIRSANFGDNWSTPMKVNDDAKGKHQYMPAMTIDQATGNLYIIYYDRRNYDDDQTDVYLAYSTDAGNTFKNIKISEAPFTPSDTAFFGDYINVSAHKGLITPIWTRTEEGKTSVWTATIKQEELTALPQ